MPGELIQSVLPPILEKAARTRPRVGALPPRQFRDSAWSLLKRVSQNTILTDGINRIRIKNLTYKHKKYAYFKHLSEDIECKKEIEISSPDPVDFKQHLMMSVSFPILRLP